MSQFDKFKPPEIAPTQVTDPVPAVIKKQYSHSRVETYVQCPHKFKLRYLDNLRTLPNDQADNALVLGNAIHTGIEKGVDAAIQQYYDHYHIITDTPRNQQIAGRWQQISDHITETIKLEYLIPLARSVLPLDGAIHEYKLDHPDFVGYVDLLVPTGNKNEFDLYDYKYTKDGSRYKTSSQLHLYKHFLEQEGKRIRHMYYLIIPKMKMPRYEKGTDLLAYRKKVKAELVKLEPYFITVDFDYKKVVKFLFTIKHICETTEYEKNQSALCGWCDYHDYCLKGDDLMNLPKNEPVKQLVKKLTLWLYGEPYTGKTTFASQFPNPLFLTTDGNIRNLMTYKPGEMPPHVSIADEVTKEGRITKRKFAWEVFRDAVSALETDKTDFETIGVDHLGELYEHCRLYIYDKEDIQHETKSGFGKGWDLVKTEFLGTIKRLVNLPYNVVLISHEDRTKDITNKGGSKITAIKPKLREGLLSNIAGMVDITARTLAEDGKHTLSFKTSEVIFGGGRLKPTATEIALDYSEFMKLYDGGTPAPATTKRTSKKKPAEPAATEETPVEADEQPATDPAPTDDVPWDEDDGDTTGEPVQNEPTDEVPAEKAAPSDPEPAAAEEAKPRVRKKRTQAAD